MAGVSNDRNAESRPDNRSIEVLPRRRERAIANDSQDATIREVVPAGRTDFRKMSQRNACGVRRGGR